MMQTRPTAVALKAEVDDLYVQFERLYQYLGRCNTEQRRHLKTLAYEIGDAINTMRAPLNL